MADKTRVAYLALITGVIGLGFSAILASWANAPGAVTGFYRMVLAQIIFTWPFLRRQQGGALRNTGQPWMEIAIALFAGLLFAGDLILWNTGVLISGATNPTLLGNMAPVWVGLGATLFFREKLPPLFWGGLALALSGAVLLLGLDALQGLDLGLGTLLGLVAGILYGGYFLVMQRSRQRLDASTSFWIAATGSTAALLLAALLLNQPLTGYPPLTWISFLALGVIVQAFGQFTFSFALGYLPASLVSPAGLAQPVMTAILAVPLLGQTISPGQVFGGTAVLAGVFLVHRSRRPQVAPRHGVD